ncbi:MAG: hypothetical protein QOK05_1234 [Chloroflexota bacterium]|jgi:hypothetical protein|nr:hypothetical protein [Chloroflexota bacterium]
MGTLKETNTQVMDRAAHRAATNEAGAYEWWTALSTFEEGDFALEPDPLLTAADATTDDIELRLYSF